MEKAERELTLKDILVIILKRAKLVAAFALGACLLLGAYGAYRSYSDQQAAAEKMCIRDRIYTGDPRADGSLCPAGPQTGSQ